MNRKFRLTAIFMLLTVLLSVFSGAAYGHEPVKDPEPTPVLKAMVKKTPGRFDAEPAVPQTPNWICTSVQVQNNGDGTYDVTASGGANWWRIAFANGGAVTAPQHSSFFDNWTPPGSGQYQVEVSDNGTDWAAWANCAFTITLPPTPTFTLTFTLVPPTNTPTPTPTQSLTVTQTPPPTLPSSSATPTPTVTGTTPPTATVTQTPPPGTTPTTPPQASATPTPTVTGTTPPTATVTQTPPPGTTPTATLTPMPTVPPTTEVPYTPPQAACKLLKAIDSTTKEDVPGGTLLPSSGRDLTFLGFGNGQRFVLKYYATPKSAGQIIAEGPVDKKDASPNVRVPTTAYPGRYELIYDRVGGNAKCSINFGKWSGGGEPASTTENASQSADWIRFGGNIYYFGTNPDQAYLVQPGLIGLHLNDRSGKPMPGTAMLNLKPGDRVDSFIDGNFTSYTVVETYDKVAQSPSGHDEIAAMIEKFKLNLGTCSGKFDQEIGQYPFLAGVNLRVRDEPHPSNAAWE